LCKFLVNLKSENGVKYRQMFILRAYLTAK